MNDYRQAKHNLYLDEKNSTDIKTAISKKSMLIASDSMMNQIDETRLSKQMEINVRCWGGCNITGMYDKLDTILKNKSYDYVILHVGTSDSVYKPSENMLTDIIKLKQYVENTYGSSVIISNLITRVDNAKADFTIKSFNRKLSNLKIPIMDNANITSNFLGRKGLHLSSPNGTSMLAKNLISLIRGL